MPSSPRTARTFVDATRRAIAQRCLDAWDLIGAIAVDDLLGASSRFRAWCDGQWPGAVWHRQVGAYAAVFGSTPSIELREAFIHLPMIGMANRISIT